MVGFDKEGYENRETTVAGHSTKGEKAEGRKSRVGLEMVEEESLVWRGKDGLIVVRQTVGTRPGSFVFLSRKLGCAPTTRTKFGQSPSR